MEQIKKKFEELLQAKYDKEYNDIGMLLSEAYAKGLFEGKAQAKAEIINLIQGGNDETGS
jgi:hypothetical protein